MVNVDADLWVMARSSVEPRPKLSAPAAEKAMHCTVPRYQAETSQQHTTSTATALAAVNIVVSVKVVAVGVLLANNTNTKVPRTDNPAPTAAPRPGRVRVARAASSTGHGRARTPMGCTTASGARVNATRCRTAPPAISAQPANRRAGGGECGRRQR